jgi:hypothetical protein
MFKCQHLKTAVEGHTGEQPLLSTDKADYRFLTRPLPLCRQLLLQSWWTLHMHQQEGPTPA